ncbi:DUF305 domain-containing protein [Biformimicrobium ophioploci]|uniref:DUF305 domain-containing protein n=1 Tax=Biformimicrobium ophioploci TaxID=3036711 RepID=A0ABQ6LWH5_9GAMM|nr:DUF305 domain-containing protein [Microbulbifer sp. NKW57]GMG86405.1 hypothetical protein MNKW57_07260 [Microbulbifer sp. NKW57]
MFGLASLAGADAPIVHPGAPGQEPREISAEEAVRVASVTHTRADARFMQDMIPHHHQAMEMAALVAKRTNNQEIIDLAGRIDSSQSDEIALMQAWLAERGETVPDPSHHHAMHTSHMMAGMATPKQMRQLAKSKGPEFDRLFLELMIRHHDGAVKMVKDLLGQSGAAYDPVLFEFTSDIVNDQTAEIKRMGALLIGLQSDPRSALEPGLADAGQASLNIRHIALIPKPPGFVNPDNPAELAPKKEEVAKETTGDSEGASEESSEGGQENSEEVMAAVEPVDEEKKRWPLMSFSNTDMAFRGDIMVAGNYHGFNTYKLKENGIPEHIASIVCPGGQGDVSIVGDLLIMSVEETRGRVDCGLEGVFEDVSDDRFRGLRIFDISDIARPVQVGAVQTCRGSHTHSVVSGPGSDGKIIVYNSGIASVRDAEEMPGCYDEVPGDTRTALFRIDVIEIPVDEPSKARIIDSPAVFADPETGSLAGLWRGGDHGEDTQKTYRTDQCHDITVFPEANIAAGACSGNGILFDISNPRKPKRLDAVTDQGFAYWHSATFNNDGTKVVFTDEWGGGMRARCRPHDPVTWGANAIYDIVDGKLEFRSHYKMPAAQTEQENCVAHNGAIVPVPGRDIFVQAWYQGGISVMDFTDSANPVEIAYFDRGPVDAEELALGGFWSSYWYNGYIYGTEIIRGIDVLELLPSDYLSKNEVAAARLADQGDAFNPQQQFSVSWPDAPEVAAAYVDQLRRAGDLNRRLGDDIEQALSEAGPLAVRGVQKDSLAGELEVLAARLKKAPASTEQSGARLKLARALTGIADRLKSEDTTATRP